MLLFDIGCTAFAFMDARMRLVPRAFSHTWPLVNCSLPVAIAMSCPMSVNILQSHDDWMTDLIPAADDWLIAIAAARENSGPKGKAPEHCCAGAGAQEEEGARARCKYNAFTSAIL